MTQRDGKAARKPRATRRGPPRIDDTTPLDEINRLLVRDPSKTRWEHITELVQRDGWKQSKDAEIHRLYSKYERQQYDPERAAFAPLRAQELEVEGFVERSQFLVDQDSAHWWDMGWKGYFPVERMPDGRWKVQRHLRGLLTYDELCAECAPYFASIAHLLAECRINDDRQAVESDESAL